MPSSYDHFTRPLHDACQLEECAEGRGAAWLQRANPVDRAYGLVSCMTPITRDPTATLVGAVAFGGMKDWAEYIGMPGKAAVYVAHVSRYRREFGLTFDECIPSRWVGRMLPRRPGTPKYMPPDRCARKVLETLPVQLLHASTMRAQARHPLARRTSRGDVEQVLVAVRPLGANGMPKN